MTIQEVNNLSCMIIANAGDGKSSCMEALDYAEAGDWEAARQALAVADEAIVKAHEIHTKLLVEEARDPAALPMTMMLIHASNHLSAAEISREFAEDVYKRQDMNDREINAPVFFFCDRAIRLFF